MPKKIEKDSSTEERIKAAARKVFTQKGYAATRTRDIAEEAGLNLALLNYYFRSKEKLFELVMTEKTQQFFGLITPILSNEATGLEEKIEQLTQHYLDMLLNNPDLPMFVLSEIRHNPGRFSKRVSVKELLVNSSFARQLQEKKPDVEALHFIITLLGMIIFPFIARPVLETSTVMPSENFNNFILERKKMIPVWVKAILET